MRLLTKPNLCTGCRACEVACVAHHDGFFGTATARIKVTKIDVAGVDTPHICRLCRRPGCVAACPVDALYQDALTGIIQLKPEKCIGCADCVEGCPFGVVTLHVETGLPLMCDLCGGEPACVKRCAPGAIIFADDDANARSKREKLSKTPQRPRQKEALR